MGKRACPRHSPSAVVEPFGFAPAIEYEKGPQKGALFVLTAGFEPTTHCLEGSCSIQLSYASVSAQYRKLTEFLQWTTGTVATSHKFIYIYACIRIFA